jgi:hypothetical protein
LHAAKTTGKKLEDERNRLALEVEDKKHKIGVISRRAKLLNDELKTQTCKQREKEIGFKEELEKLSQTVGTLTAKLKRQEPTEKRSSSPKPAVVERMSLSVSRSMDEGRRTRKVLPESPRKPEANAWRRLLGHLSEPEMDTIRKSVELVGLEGVREVMSGLII